MTDVRNTLGPQLRDMSYSGLGRMHMVKVLYLLMSGLQSGYHNLEQNYSELQP